MFRLGAFNSFQPIFPWPVVSLLINGHGQFNCTFFQCTQTVSSACNESAQCSSVRPPFFGDCNATAHEPDTFLCSGNYTRIRLINGASTVPLRFWIDRHNLTIVARDGIEVVPFKREYHNHSSRHLN